MSKFSLNTTRIGFLVFSDNAQIEFPLDNAFNSTEELEEAVLDASYPGDSTYTHLAIYKATEMLVAAEQENEHSETSIPKISVVFTDGQSNVPQLTVQAARNATESGVTTFSVGIGDRVNRDEAKYLQ
jgi:collagen type VI alpha